MTLTRAILEIERLGLDLFEINGRPGCRPASAVDEELAAFFRENRDDLLAAVKVWGSAAGPYLLWFFSDGGNTHLPTQPFQLSDDRFVSNVGAFIERLYVLAATPPELLGSNRQRVAADVRSLFEHVAGEESYLPSQTVDAAVTGNGDSITQNENGDALWR